MITLQLRTLCRASLLACLAGPLLAGGSGFTAGEFIYYSQAIPGLGTTGGGILRMDPTTGATSVMLELWSANAYRDGIAYDPYRERVIFYASFPSEPNEDRVYLMDGFGNTTPMGNEDASVHGFAPANGGRLYFLRDTPGAPTSFDISYLDAADQQHVLMDASGTQPYKPPVNWAEAMVYDAGTHALFVAVQRNAPWNCGSTSPNSQVLRIPLSPDGSRITGVVECTEVVTDPTLGNVPRCLTHGPAGQLAIIINTHATGPVPRMQLVDTGTLAVAPFAWSDHSFLASTNAGTWSSELGRMVYVDSFNNVLRSFGAGEVGAGSVITPSIPISGGGSGEGISLIEVPLDASASSVGTYCQGKLSSEGCTPVIDATGFPSASAGAGFTIASTLVPAQKPGLFFYGHAGPAMNPFQGGTLCVQPALIRTQVLDSGGAGACGGMFSLDFNAYTATGSDGQISPGSVLHGQFWFRDPAHPINGTGLSNGVTFTMAP